jgi:uncharacterized integral membrane protein
MANLMFDTQLRKVDYDRMNSVIDRRTALFYGATTMTHLTVLSYATYLLRYRTLNRVQTLALGTAFFFGFQAVNSIEYKLLVDKHVIDEARSIGQGSLVQPNGTFRPRGLNF